MTTISVVMPVISIRTLAPPAGPVADPVPGIPYVPGGGLYQQAVASVQAQKLHDATVKLCVAIDQEKKGAGATRQKALDMADTEWVSILDDDDLMYPWHLQTHLDLLREHNADVAYSWFSGNQPFGPKGEVTHRGRVFDPKEPHHITSTLSVRTELAKAAGYLQPDGPMHEEWSGEDWQFILRLCELGAKFVGTGDVTWHYRLHHQNTSGLASRW